MKIIFVCLGNICRSPMAEFYYKYHLRNIANIEICSRGTSDEESGNNCHPKTIQTLINHQLPYYTHEAKQITLEDIKTADLIIAMDSSNLRDLKLMFDRKYHGKFHLYLESEDILDPYYTGTYEKTYNDIESRFNYWLNQIKEKAKLF